MDPFAIAAQLAFLSTTVLDRQADHCLDVIDLEAQLVGRVVLEVDGVAQWHQLEGDAGHFAELRSQAAGVDLAESSAEGLFVKGDHLIHAMHPQGRQWSTGLPGPWRKKG